MLTTDPDEADDDALAKWRKWYIGFYIFCKAELFLTTPICFFVVTSGHCQAGVPSIVEIFQHGLLNWFLMVVIARVVLCFTALPLTCFGSEEAKNRGQHAFCVSVTTTVPAMFAWYTVVAHAVLSDHYNQTNFKEAIGLASTWGLVWWLGGVFNFLLMLVYAQVLAATAWPQTDPPAVLQVEEPQRAVNPHCPLTPLKNRVFLQLRKTDLQCSICLQTYERDDVVLELKCSHVFHYVCVARWVFQSGNSCPFRCPRPSPLSTL